MDPLQQSPTAPWPDLEDDGPVAWPAAAGPGGVAVTVEAPATPPAWPVPAAVTLVREIQKLVPAGARPDAQAWPFPRRAGDVKTYSPFRQ